MTNAYAQLPDDRQVADGTSNISRLLNEEDLTWLRTLTPAILTEQFGPRTDIYVDPERGYSDPEWYWQYGDAIWGIGFRWNEARLRGNEDDGAAQFVAFLKEATTTAPGTRRA